MHLSYFVVFRFDPPDVKHLLATPVEQDHHVNSNWIYYDKHDGIGLALTHAGRTREDGFNLEVGTRPLGRLEKHRLWAASCINDEFAMIATLGEINFWGAKHIYEDSPLFEAIREGQELPFLLVAIPRGGRATSFAR